VAPHTKWLPESTLFNGM